MGSAVQRSYSEPQVEEALIAAATLGIRPAARKLDIPHTTLHLWTQEQPDRWAAIREQEAPKWRAKAAAAFEDVVDTLTELEAKAITRLEAQMDSLEPKDTAGALRNISTAKGINSTHVAQMRGQPTEIVEHRHSIPDLDKVMSHLLREAETVLVVRASGCGGRLR